MHVLFFSQGKPSRFGFYFEDFAWRMINVSSASGQDNAACVAAPLGERECEACSFQLGCFAFLQQHQARSSSAHVFRWAEAFKDSAPLLLFPGQTQPGISAVKRTLRAMKVSSTCILQSSQVLVHVLFKVPAGLLPLPISQPALSSFPGASGTASEGSGSTLSVPLASFASSCTCRRCLGNGFFSVLWQTAPSHP